MHAITQADPLQEVRDVFAVVGDLFADDAEREGDIFPSRQVVEEAEVLEYNANATAQLRALGGGNLTNVLVEHVDLAPRGVERHEQETQQ